MLKRDPDLGNVLSEPGKPLSSTFSKEDTLAMYRRSALTRQFETKLQERMKSRDFKMPIYLSLGQEFVSAAVATAFSGCSIFAQHRGHGWYLSYGGDPQKLVDELYCLPSGCCGGMAGSASISDASIKMYGHSGLLGDQVPIAVGAAIAGTGRVLCVAGDAAVEEDYFLSSVGFAVLRKAPILFICEDNGLSILTKTNVRRSWEICNIVQSFGIKAIDIADDPWLIMYHVRRHLNNLPCLINIRTCRKLWHAGHGDDGEPEWDRLKIVIDEIHRLGLSKECDEIESQCRNIVTEYFEGK